MNLKLDSWELGNCFDEVARKAQVIATNKKTSAEFEFNGCLCVVNANTDLKHLWRDYRNHWTMDWSVIGPDCLQNYTPEVQAELEKRNKVAAEKRAIEEKEYRAKEEKERAEFIEKTKGIIIEFKDRAAWDAGRDKNADPYGNCIYEYAEGWAKLMQIEILKGNSLKDVAEKTSHELGFLGITGFMYGAAVSVLSHCWIHGEYLRKWHNKEYKHEGEGVVNPACLTMVAK